MVPDFQSANDAPEPPEAASPDSTWAPFANTAREFIYVYLRYIHRAVPFFYKTSFFVSAIENQQGFKIACLEEISLNNNWIKKNHILKAIKFYGKCEYSEYLKKLL